MREFLPEIAPAAFWLVTSGLFAVNAVIAVLAGSGALFGILCSVTAILAAVTYFAAPHGDRPEGQSPVAAPDRRT
jgi:hypothetical protein